jgi:hypothetical protein
MKSGSRGSFSWDIYILQQIHNHKPPVMKSLGCGIVSSYFNWRAEINPWCIWLSSRGSVGVVSLPRVVCTKLQSCKSFSRDKDSSILRVNKSLT